jgi:hypothetical protein
MPLSDGDAAAEGDVWFRVLTEESYIRKGRIHHSAFTGKATIARPHPAKSRSWSHELSGRLRSRSADDILPAAIAYCQEVSRRAERKKEFAGVMFTRVADARKSFGKITIDVHYTPLEADLSHADFTFTGSTDADIPDLVNKLPDLVTGLHPSQLALLPCAIGCE